MQPLEAHMMTSYHLHRQHVLDLITQISVGTSGDALKPFTQAVFASVEALAPTPRPFHNPPTHYVSLVNDLRDVYLAFNADGVMAVREYLEEKYGIITKAGIVWKLPWHNIYEELPSITVNPVVIDCTFHRLTAR
jgi:hypothetical protein